MLTPCPLTCRNYRLLCSETRFAYAHLIWLFSFMTPLHLAASNGHLETCRLLLEFKVDVNERNFS